PLLDPGDPGALPPGPDPVPVAPSHRQLSLSLGYDRETGAFVAQPRTFDEESGQLLAAHVATFDAAWGTEQGWFALPETELLAGGLAVETEGAVLLGQGTSLLRFQVTSRALEAVVDLAGLVKDISGLAVTPEDELLVLDGDGDQIVVLPWTGR
ncbi:MAG: hypothetical protein ACO3JL_17835, partial [Myxococcota bacterium]